MTQKAGGDKKTRRIAEARRILDVLGFPKQQCNDRSALTLLALLDLKPGDQWKESRAPLMGITPMMEFFSQEYDRRYAPNTRETVRRQTVHQLAQAGLIDANPDDDARPTNSPRTVYQISESALALLRTFGTSRWNKALSDYLLTVGKLKERYARERSLTRIPIQLARGKQVRLSPGKHNRLVQSIVKQFCPNFVPGGKLMYVGDTSRKWAFWDEKGLLQLGITPDVHGKMPDVIVYQASAAWLFLIEAVTSHGPINPKRRNELAKLFCGSHAGLVYVTAFPDRHTMHKYLAEIAWETEVWIAESPTHLVHFDGERFLGPYENAD